LDEIKKLTAENTENFAEYAEVSFRSSTGSDL